MTVPADVRIERASRLLRVPGTDRGLGLRLAGLVAERLAGALTLAPGDASLPLLRLHLTAHPGEQPAALADRIAARAAELVSEAVEGAR